jgi:starch synthase (maltosyl-transferring)
MDLSINHTARDSILVHKHPEWYLHDEKGDIISPFARDPDNIDGITVWGDLAEVDNEHSADKSGLWSYWAELLRYYIGMGFKGFRCDAAYKVPSDLWRYLISEALELKMV